MTGWNLPPGVTTAMINGLSEEGPCGVCGGFVDDCICPECPVCQTIGDPDCYVQHDMVHSQAQIDSMAHAKAMQAEELRQELELFRELSFHADLLEMGDHPSDSLEYAKMQASAIGWASN